MVEEKIVSLTKELKVDNALEFINRVKQALYGINTIGFPYDGNEMVLSTQVTTQKGQILKVTCKIKVVD